MKQLRSHYIRTITFALVKRLNDGLPVVNQKYNRVLPLLPRSSEGIKFICIAMYVPQSTVDSGLGDLNCLGHLGHSLCRSHGSTSQAKSMVNLCLQYSLIAIAWRGGGGGWWVTTCLVEGPVKAMS